MLEQRDSNGLPDMTTARGVFVAAMDQVSVEVSGEVIILNLKNGVYYSLKGVGSRIWQLLQVPRAVVDLRESLLAQYDVEADRCERDLNVLLQDLGAEGLVEYKGDAS